MNVPPDRFSDADRPLLAGGEALRREVDRAARGGEKYHPQSVEEAREHLRPQVHSIVAAVRELPEPLRARRVVIEATLLPNYLAASYFPTALLQAADLVPVGTRPARGTYRTRTAEKPDQPTKRLLLAGTDRSLRRLQAIVEGRLAERRERGAQETLREFEEIALPTFDEVVRVHEPVEEEAQVLLWEAVLHPLDALEWADSPGDPQSVYGKWRALVDEAGGETIDDYRRAEGGLTFVPVRARRAALEPLARFNPLRTIRPMPTMRPIPATRLRRVPGLARPQPVPGDASPQSDIRVALFDGGLDDPAPLITRFVREVDLTPEPKAEEEVTHGAAVSSACLFGYVEPGEQLPVPAAAVDHFRVFPDPDPLDPDAYWILDQIEDIVGKNDYDVVNLSLGPDQPIDDDTPHLWTIKLDRLAYEKGTLFVSAVGNSGGRVPTGENRIQPASDMVNGVGVGACTSRPPDSPWARAPYSSVGPGRPGARVQPNGVAFGGVDGNPF